MDSTLMCAHQPPLQQRHHTMYTGKEVLAFQLMALYTSVVHVAAEPHVSVQFVCSHDAAWLNSFSYETMQAGFGQIRDVSQSDTANAISVFLNCDDDYGLILR